MPGGTLRLFNTQQWSQRLTFDSNCVEQLYSVYPLPSCATASLNGRFNKCPHHNHVETHCL